MNIEAAELIATSREKLLSFMTTEEYARVLAENLDRVSHVELLGNDEKADGRRELRFRYTAPTELPFFLRKWKKKAPPEVHWDEVVVLEAGGNRIDFEIQPDVPDHWREYFENHGAIYLEEVAEGLKLTRQLHFELHYAGLGKLIERALKSEVQTILEGQNRVLADHFLH